MRGGNEKGETELKEKKSMKGRRKNEKGRKEKK